MTREWRASTAVERNSMCQPPSDEWLGNSPPTKLHNTPQTTTTPSPPTQLPLPSLIQKPSPPPGRTDPHAPLPPTHQVRHPNPSQLLCIRGMGKSGPMYGSVQFRFAVRFLRCTHCIENPTIHPRARATQGKQVNLFPSRCTPTLSMEIFRAGSWNIGWGTVPYRGRRLRRRQ